ncbi:hypothetical protein P175DRAFT_0466539 [Aspergillus ochraceoroseus IBT 24754]|uniref:Anaphase-promoting complex subunit 4 WD40 domain-containing protein n=2 Tax=Aspergillus ochraceoroseus TaxID=138278 RepID=A0A2T5LMJ3_9EURO|nr:uncharacterized protein P175DRAFT_0466539 [Aspergillus ochraceoroseus IBT 24754]KKK25024.1 hypothetical protein AOCH_000631 [Aspergillus ochraceoroseus]PTU17496.1 hypothetical protein P175DRAFT_0466539 [Aspergillus ochraceoroseus IBT 24754]
MASPQHPSSTTTIFLDQPPSCLQFCPESPDHLVIGTYLLSETKGEEDESTSIQQTKTGSLQLWHLHPDTSALTQIQRLALPYAVFDLQFHPRNPRLLGIASSAASVALFAVSAGGISLLWTRSVHEDPSIPALFLAWTPENWLPDEGADGFAVTFSDGRTSVFGARSLRALTGTSTATTTTTTTTTTSTDEKEEEEDGITELSSFNAKQPIEIWVVALAAMASTATSPSITPYLFTGDDFGSLHSRRYQEPRPQSSGPDRHRHARLPPPPPLPLLLLLAESDDRARHHTAGVTAILPLPLPLTLTDGAPCLLTGSYDEYLRVYRATRTGEVLAETCLGGGVWRLQLLRTAHDVPAGKWTFVVLASCMHAGTRVVRVSLAWDGGSGSRGEIEVLGEFTEHESMNYASDVWKPRGGHDLDDAQAELCVVVSSSFYDRRVCVWRVNV